MATRERQPGSLGRNDAGERVILVDRADRSRGTASKLDAHRRGLRHRAVSVIICNDRGEMLLQQRAPGKYHSGGLWANACCGHPRPGEAASAAARRRLREELGIASALQPLCTVAYRLTVGPQLIENEVTHVFFGRYEGEVRPNPAEVSAYRWAGRDELRATVAADPARFAAWFRFYLAGPLRDLALPPPVASDR